MSARSSQFNFGAPGKPLEGEAFLCKRLHDHGAHMYPVSPQYPLKERIRRAILDARLECVTIGRNAATKKCETYAEAFERLYDEPLTPKRKGKSR